ncbi:MAG: sugar MFS transporter [Leadbetterella sp.]
MEAKAVNKSSDYLFPLLIIGMLFFIFGFVTWVNGTLISFFKGAFSLSNTQSTLVTFAFFIAYTVMAIPSSWLLKKTGLKKGMSIGLLIMALGCLIFIPAAKSASYELFLVALFTIGIGLTVLQTASNPYVTILGPIESAAQRISFMGVANKTAGIISQSLFGTLLLTSQNVDVSIYQKLDKVVFPYASLSGILVFLGIGIFFVKGLPDLKSETQDDLKHTDDSHESVFSHANLVLGCLALFCCVGLEVICGDYIINHGEAMGFTNNESKQFGTYFLYIMLFGYISSIFLIPKFVSQHNWLKYTSMFGVVVTLMVVFTTGIASVYSVAALGYSIAIMWPAIWPLALDGVKKHLNLASALLVMMIAGGAILPLAYGKLTDNYNSNIGFSVLLPLYLVILWFATYGYKIKKW